MVCSCTLFLKPAGPPLGMLVYKLAALQHPATSALHIGYVSGTKIRLSGRSSESSKLLPCASCELPGLSSDLPLPD